MKPSKIAQDTGLDVHVQMGIEPTSGTVVIDFGQDIQYFALHPKEALHFAASIIDIVRMSGETAELPDVSSGRLTGRLN